MGIYSTVSGVRVLVHKKICMSLCKKKLSLGLRDSVLCVSNLEGLHRDLTIVFFSSTLGPMFLRHTHLLFILLHIYLKHVELVKVSGTWKVHPELHVALLVVHQTLGFLDNYQ